MPIELKDNPVSEQISEQEPEKKKRELGPLSHSSAKTLTGCEQKYVYYKVQGAKKDGDYFKSDALAIGSAVHHIQEMTKHVKSDKILDLLIECETDRDIQMSHEHKCLVHAMTVKYWRLQYDSGFKVLEVEFSIENETTTGKVDAILEDKDGKWWIVDLKTARTLAISSLPLLPTDPQLNLYASFAKDIAERFDLDLKSFGGTRWRVVSKPTIKRKSEESDLDYTKRLIKAVKTWDVEIPVELLAPEETARRHVEIYKRSKALYSPKAKPKKNYANCMSFFKPCEYWSRCHGGHLHSDIKIKVTEGP